MTEVVTCEISTVKRKMDSSGYYVIDEQITIKGQTLEECKKIYDEVRK